MKKILSVEHVAQELSENQSAEFEQETVVYWLHVTESGEIVSCYSKADNSFSYSVPYGRYGIAEPQENPQKIYDTETMDNPIFCEVVRNLTRQANDWLKSEQPEKATEKLPEVSPSFFWWSNDDIEVYEIDGRFYALAGWNGEVYTSCWECLDCFTDVDNKKYIIKPVYRYEAERIDLDQLDEDSDEYEKAFEIVELKVR